MGSDPLDPLRMRTQHAETAYCEASSALAVKVDRMSSFST